MEIIPLCIIFRTKWDKKIKCKYKAMNFRIIYFEIQEGTSINLNYLVHFYSGGKWSRRLTD